MSTIVKYHEKTNEIALLEHDGAYWIGVYDHFSNLGSLEPPYYWVKGDFASASEGLVALAECTVDDFGF